MAPLHRREDGSQAIEFAMSIPLVLAVVATVLVVGQIVLVHIGLHQLAATAARLAAVTDDDAVLAAVDPPAGVTLRIDPPSGVRQVGDLVRVHAERPIMLPGGSQVLGASAAFVTEDVP